MSNIINLPAASRFKDLKHNMRDPGQEFILRVDHCAGTISFLELLEMIYGIRPDARNADMASIWVYLKAESHFTLAGARFAARVCGLSFEEVGRIS